MNKLSIKIILVLVAILGFSAILYMTITAQPPTSGPVRDDVGYGQWAHLEWKVTTELIKNNPNSNVYTRIDIKRHYGIPRVGIITDSVNQTKDTVRYIPNNITRHNGGINGPRVTDTSITVWWRGGFFTVQIMNVLTGDIVLNRRYSGQNPSLFEVPIGGFTMVDDTVNQNETGTIEFPEPFYPKTDRNPGTTVTFSNLPNGLYWLYISDDSTKEIYKLYTIRKGV